MSDRQLVFMYIIAERKLKDELIDQLTHAGGALIDFVYGHGYHESQGILDMLGFGEKKNKVVITCLFLKEKAEAMFDALNNEFKFGQPATGIAFTVPIEKLVY